MILGQAPILFPFEWLVSKLARMEGWKHYVQVHRSYPICRGGRSVKHGSWSLGYTRPTIVLLRAFRRLRFELFIIRSYRPKSFQSQSGTTILRGKCGCLQVNPLSNLFPSNTIISAVSQLSSLMNFSKQDLYLAR